LWFLLKELQETHELGLVLVTHDLEEAFFMGDSIGIMINGSIRQEGRKGDVYERPRDLEVARFLGIGNLLGGEILERNDRTVSVYCPDLAAAFTAAMPNSDEAWESLKSGSSFSLYCPISTLRWEFDRTTLRSGSTAKTKSLVAGRSPE
ncbi:hypothetical protein ACFL2Q_08415, partial [Thermodesulfobacteriota bacterium]